jgi:hypothetical protein
METDKTNPEVEIILDKPRKMRFSLGSIKKYYEKTGTNLLTYKFTDDTLVDLDMITGMAWTGLIRDDPSLTFEDVDDLIDMRNMIPVQLAIMQAWTLFSPEKDSSPLVPKTKRAKGK